MLPGMHLMLLSLPLVALSFRPYLLMYRMAACAKQPHTPIHVALPRPTLLSASLANCSRSAMQDGLSDASKASERVAWSGTVPDHATNVYTSTPCTVPDHATNATYMATQ